MALERLVEAHTATFSSWESCSGSLVAEGMLGAQRVVAARPQTFMNLSGRAVAALATRFQLGPDRVVVLHVCCSPPSPPLFHVGGRRVLPRHADHL